MYLLTFKRLDFSFIYCMNHSCTFYTLFEIAPKLTIGQSSYTERRFRRIMVLVKNSVENKNLHNIKYILFHLLRCIFSVSSFEFLSFNSLISRLKISSLVVSAAVKFLALINLISARFVGRLHSGQVLPVLNHWSIQLWPKRCPQGKDEIAWGPGCEYFHI